MLVTLSEELRAQLRQLEPWLTSCATRLEVVADIMELAGDVFATDDVRGLRQLATAARALASRTGAIVRQRKL